MCSGPAAHRAFLYARISPGTANGRPNGRPLAVQLALKEGAEQPGGCSAQTEDKPIQNRSDSHGESARGDWLFPLAFDIRKNGNFFESSHFCRSSCRHFVDSLGRAARRLLCPKACNDDRMEKTTGLAAKDGFHPLRDLHYRLSLSMNSSVIVASAAQTSEMRSRGSQPALTFSCEYAYAGL